MKKKLFGLLIVTLLFVLAFAVSCKKQEKAEAAAVVEEPKVDYGPSIPPEKTAKVTWDGCRRSD